MKNLLVVTVIMFLSTSLLVAQDYKKPVKKVAPIVEVHAGVGVPFLTVLGQERIVGMPLQASLDVRVAKKLSLGVAYESITTEPTYGSYADAGESGLNFENKKLSLRATFPFLKGDVIDLYGGAAMGVRMVENKRMSQGENTLIKKENKVLASAVIGARLHLGKRGILFVEYGQASTINTGIGLHF